MKISNRIKAGAAAVIAAASLTVVAAPEAHAMSGDQIYLLCGSTPMTVQKSDGYRNTVSGCNWSANNLYAFRVDTCWLAKNIDTGYIYKAGWHVFSAPNAKLYLQHYYQGWC